METNRPKKRGNTFEKRKTKNLEFSVLLVELLVKGLHLQAKISNPIKIKQTN